MAVGVAEGRVLATVTLDRSEPNTVDEVGVVTGALDELGITAVLTGAVDELAIVAVLTGAVGELAIVAVLTGAVDELAVAAILTAVTVIYMGYS